MRKAYLALADGSVYEGLGFGAETDAVGELVFSTGVVGYMETLTDPAYAGQIVLQTFPLIGNYGVIQEDVPPNCHLQGYVVREYCDTPSNFRSTGNLDAYLKEKGIPGICGLDTRALTRKIRECGAMNAMICAEPPADFSAISRFSPDDLIAQTTCSQSSVLPAEGEQKYRVALMHYGAPGAVAHELQKRGCEVTIFPAHTAAETILSGEFDGVVLSDGAGDPAQNPEYAQTIGALLGKLPIMGISLGHQLLALAAGACTEKLEHGHRGANQPVKDLHGARTYITAQNHGYGVVASSIQQGEISFINANDGSCEGVDYPALNAFGVQFQPECSGGPQDTSFLYDRFISMMGGEKTCR